VLTQLDPVGSSKDSGSETSSGLVEEVPQRLGGIRVSQLRERLGLDLADPLTGDTEGLSHLLECSYPAVFEAEA
jgi:hypothetical protein